jgi:hypothetical protein
MTARQPVSASKIEEWLLDDHPGAERPGGDYPQVKGPLVLRSTKPVDGKSLADMQFEDDVDLQEVEVKGSLDFSRCLFAKRLLLRNATVRGELRLDDAEVLNMEPLYGDSGVGIDLLGAHLQGGLSAQRLNARGNTLDMSAGCIEHHANLDGAQLKMLDGHGVQLKGDLRLDSFVRGNETIGTEVETLDLALAHIDGDLRLEGVQATQVTLRCATIGGDVLMTPKTDGELGSVTRRSVIRAAANLSNIDIRGSLRLVGLRAASVNLVAGNIRGEVLARGARIKQKSDNASGADDSSADELLPVATEIGEFDLSSATIGSNLSMRGVAINTLTLQHTTVGGSVEIKSDWDWDRSQHQYSVDTRNSVRADRKNWLKEVEGLLDDWLPILSPVGFLRSTLGNCTAKSLRAGGLVELSGVAIMGELDLIGAHLGSALWIVPDTRAGFLPVVTGDVHLSTIVDNPYIEIRALRCGGEVRIVGSKLGRTLITLGALGELRQWKTEPEKNLVPCTVGMLTVTDSSIAGMLALTHIQVNGAKQRAGLSGVTIQGCQIESDLLFWSTNWIARALQELPEAEQERIATALQPWKHGAAIVGPVTVRNCSIGGDCDLTLLKAQGPIRIEDTHIRGNVLMRSLTTLTQYLTNHSGVEHLKAMAAEYRTIAPHLSLRASTVAQNVDLTGLTLIQDESDADSAKTCGHLDARYLAVNGDLRTFATEGSSASDRDAYMDVPGRFDLSSGAAAQLHLSGLSFQDQHRPWHCGRRDIDKVRGARERGVSLAGGRFRNVTLLNRTDVGCPYPLDLSDVEVSNWDIGKTDGKSDKENGAKAIYYETLLSSDSIFRRSSYRSIEQTLRNHGESDSSDEMYRAMSRELQRKNGPKTWHWLARVGEFVDRAFGKMMMGVRLALTPARWFWQLVVWPKWLKFGTDPMPLLVVIFFLALVSYPVYREPGNVMSTASPSSTTPVSLCQSATPSTTLLLTNLTLPKHPASPCYENWGPLDAVELLVRKHLAFLPMRLQNGWDARDDVGLDYDLGAFVGNVCQPPETERAMDFSAGTATCADGVQGGHFRATWLNAETWAGLMSVLNLLMWPLVLTFAIRRVLRQSP